MDCDIFNWFISLSVIDRTFIDESGNDKKQQIDYGILPAILPKMSPIRYLSTLLSPHDHMSVAHYVII